MSSQLRRPGEAGVVPPHQDATLGSGHLAVAVTRLLVPLTVGAHLDIHLIGRGPTPHTIEGTDLTPRTTTEGTGLTPHTTTVGAAIHAQGLVLPTTVGRRLVGDHAMIIPPMRDTTGGADIAATLGAIHRGGGGATRAATHLGLGEALGGVTLGATPLGHGGLRGEATREATHLG